MRDSTLDLLYRVFAQCLPEYQRLCREPPALEEHSAVRRALATRWLQEINFRAFDEILPHGPHLDGDGRPRLDYAIVAWIDALFIDEPSPLHAEWVKHPLEYELWQTGTGGTRFWADCERCLNLGGRGQEALEVYWLLSKLGLSRDDIYGIEERQIADAEIFEHLVTKPDLPVFPQDQDNPDDGEFRWHSPWGSRG